MIIMRALSRQLPVLAMAAARAIAWGLRIADLLRTVTAALARHGQ
jgi:hypothetical protein